MIRAAIDTNVVVSGMISPTGNESLVLLAVHQSLIVPCYSEAIIAEYAEVLRGPKFRFPENQVAALVKKIRDHGIPAGRGAGIPDISPDPDDTIFIQCAASAKAAYIITGNKRHFPKPTYGVCRVVTASKMLEIIAQQI